MLHLSSQAHVHANLRISLVDPEVSVVICTRNRGQEVVAAIESVLANQHPNFELIIVDQSTNDDTENAVETFIDDPRFRYIHTSTVGVGISRNIGLMNARADIVCYTDDDCTVSTNWLLAFHAVFRKYPNVSVVFCSVDPAPQTRRDGAIPYRHYTHDKIIRSLVQYANSYGMGAGMAVRKSVILNWGGFDETLGPGSFFRSGEDIDIALRMLLHKSWVYELSSEAVTHHGFRNHTDFRELTKRDFYAIGAVHAKVAKRTLGGILPMMLYNSLYISLWMPFAMIFSFKRPRGFNRFFYYWIGFFKGLRTPVDFPNLLYLRQT